MGHLPSGSFQCNLVGQVQKRQEEISLVKMPVVIASEEWVFSGCTVVTAGFMKLERECGI